MFVVDEINGNYASVEIDEGVFVSIPLWRLPEGVKEGDVLSVSIDREETERRMKNTSARLTNLFNRNKEG